MSKSLLDSGGNITISSLEDHHTNDDGSPDVAFGPDPPDNHPKNWIKTHPGKGFFLVFRSTGRSRATSTQPGSSTTARRRPADTRIRPSALAADGFRSGVGSLIVGATDLRRRPIDPSWVVTTENARVTVDRTPTTNPAREEGGARQHYLGARQAVASG
jgi:hypothetical protein